METLYAVDLGKRKLGLAYFVGAELEAAWTLHGDGSPGDMADVTLRCAADKSATWVCEKPLVYKNFTKAAEDIKSLLDVHVALRRRGVRFTQEFLPVQWKGNVPKPIHHDRLREALSSNEQKVFDTLGHDARDAVGIGLYALKRTRRGGTAC